MIQLSTSINTLGSTFSSVDSNIYNRFESTNDKDVFEKVIDDLMVERYTKDPEMKEYIKSLPRGNKRVAILSLIGEDNLLWSRINDILKERKTGYQRLKEVYFLLRDYVKIADVERKKHGEILTPFKELAEPMVKLVEKYDSEFWKNPNHKVLDSSAGYGTFLILSAYKFMVGLKDWEPDEEKRFKWIVENCLYYGELQARSVFSWLVAIDPYDEYKTNTYYGSFLTEDFDNHMKKVWSINSFDLIIQNPPYQQKKQGYKKSQSIWQFFVQKSLNLLKDDGYMVMVHPGSWRNIDGDFKATQNLIKSNSVLELHIHNINDGIKIFGAETRFDYYILKKSNSDCKTVIRCEDGHIEIFNISNMEFLPNGKFSQIFNLMSENNRAEILYSRSDYGTDKPWVSKIKSDLFNVPVISVVRKSGEIENIFSSKISPRHNKPKVIWSNTRITSIGTFIDKNGEYGINQFCYAIIDEVDNLEKISQCLKSEKFISMMSNCITGTFPAMNFKVIGLFKKNFWKEFI